MLPDNHTLIHLIDSYVRSKVDQLHYVCFCVSIETDVCEEDLEVMKVFFNLLGPENLKVLSSQMKQGIFFTGSIDADDWIKTSDSVYQTFETICDY